jgi:hypothetical protein
MNAGKIEIERERKKENHDCTSNVAIENDARTYGDGID